MENLSKMYKGIVLAGGYGTRLYPTTLGISKQLIPIYDKPMIYYPISVLMLAGIKEILLITDKHSLTNYQRLLGDGTDLGISLEYKIQENPNGLAEAFIIGEDFIGNNNVALILGDNIFYGYNFSFLLNDVIKSNKGATIFAYHVANPRNFGIVELSNEGKPLSVEEKPLHPKSNYAITGLYFYNNEVLNIAKNIKPSKRGELEISSINSAYLEKNLLNVELFGRGFAWLDTGTNKSLTDAAQFIYTIEKRQGLKVACLEEISFRKGWLSLEKLKKKSSILKGTSYGEYLEMIVSENSN